MRVGTLGVAMVAVWLGTMQAVRADDAPAPETQRWVSSIALGVAVTGGNSDTSLFTGRFETKRVWEQDELNYFLEFAYGKNDGVENQNTAHTALNWKHTLKDPWYFSATADLLHDSVADLAYRLTLGPAIGYYFIKNDATKLSGEFGPAYVRKDLYGTPADDFIALRFGEKFEHKFNDSVRMWQSLEVTPEIGDFENFQATFEIGVESALSKTLALRVVGQDRYDNQPAAGNRRNDTSLVASIAYKF